MKKLLTILALVLALGLICCAGLAESYDQLKQLTTEGVLQTGDVPAIDAELANLSTILDGESTATINKYTWYDVTYRNFCEDALVVTIYYNGPEAGKPDGHAVTEWTKTISIPSAIAHVKVTEYTIDGKDADASLVTTISALPDACRYSIWKHESCKNCDWTKDTNLSKAHVAETYKFIDNDDAKANRDNPIKKSAAWAAGDDVKAAHLGYYTVDLCKNCKAELTDPKFQKATTAHDYSIVSDYVIIGHGVRVYANDDWATFNKYQCTSEVHRAFECVCGARSDKEQVLPVRYHNYGTVEYWVLDAAGMYNRTLAGGIDEQIALCEEVNTTETLVKVKICVVCNQAEEDKVIGKGRVNPVTGAFGHVNHGGSANTIASWGKIIDQATCMKEGKASDFCIYCDKLMGAPKSFPRLDHQYTIKVYKPETATCKNGLTLKYQMLCGMCQKYWEGGVLNPTYPNSEKVTPEQLVALNQGAKLQGIKTPPVADDDIWEVEFGYRVGPTNAGSLIPDIWELNTDVDGTPNYDSDGHFYIPTVLVDRLYECEPQITWKYNCIWCGKEKLKFHQTSDMMNRPDWVVDSYVPVDCTHATVTYKCRICDSKSPLHTKYTETVELKNTDPKAHYGDTAKANWVELNETYVAPTCVKAGSITKKCMNCGETVKVNLGTIDHTYGEWKLGTSSDNGYVEPPKNTLVYLQYCQVCGAVNSKFVAPGDTFNPKSNYYRKIGTTNGTCLAPSTTTYVYVTINSKGEEELGKKVVVAGAYGDHIMAHRTDLDKAATCTEPGIEYYVCTVCGNYDVVKKAFTGYYETKTIPAGHTWGEWKVTKEATPTAAGEETRTCSACKAKETKPIAKLANPAKYEVKDLDYTNPVATGSVKLEKDTDALTKAYARVTFFLANGDCMIQIVEVDKDNNFTAGAIGNFVHISVVIVDTEDAYGADEAIEHAHGNGGIKL